MDKETIAEYKGLVSLVDKHEREQASNKHKTKFKSKIKNVYDSRALAEDELHGHNDTHNSHSSSSNATTPGAKIKAFAWPLTPEILKIKPKQHYRLTTDAQFSDILESTVHQQASSYFPCYLSSLELKTEEKIIQDTVRSTAQHVQLFLTASTSAVASNSKAAHRRSQRHHKASQNTRRKASARTRLGPSHHQPLLNWQDILDNAQTAGWPSAVIERARARLTTYYCPSETLN